ncbi:hypothetical protein HK102_002050 [Quaeritorhiza haematococci]|nr:hypothetical protein HK102_002050 [Quaeritorhiza haematococci]
MHMVGHLTGERLAFLGRAGFGSGAQPGEQLRVFRGHNNRVYHLTLARNNQALLSTSGDGTVKEWNLAGTSDTEVHTYVHNTNKSSAVNPGLPEDGNTFFCGGGDGVVKQWNMDTKQLISVAPRHPQHSTNCNLHCPATRGANGTVIVHDLSPLALRTINVTTVDGATIPGPSDL